MLTPSYEKKVLFLVVVIAAVLRVWDIGWSLPEVYEEATPLAESWEFWNWGGSGLDFNPHFFIYPALPFYLHFLLQVFHYAIGHLIGGYPDLHAFQKAFEADPTFFFLIGRLLTTTFDIGIIVTVFLLAKQYANGTVGVLASLLVSINPLHIEEAQINNVDTVLTFFVVLSLLFICRVYETAGVKWYGLAGLSIGLAAASKYTGALLIPVLIIGHVIRSRTLLDAIRSLRNLRLVFAIALAGLVFLILNPYIILDSEKFLSDFGFNRFHMAHGHFGIADDSSSLAFYILESLPRHLGWPFFLIAGVSTLVVLFRREKGDFVLPAFAVVYIVTIVSWKMRADRYILPILPVLTLVGAQAVAVLWNRWHEYFERRWSGRFVNSTAVQVMIGVVIGAFICGQPIYAALKYHLSHSLPDTRSVAKEWIEQLVAPGSVVAMAPLGMTIKRPIITCPIPYSSVTFEKWGGFYDARWYEDYDLVIGSSFDYSRYKNEPRKYGEFLQFFYDSLQSSWRLLFEVAPSDFQRGPQIWLYTPISSKRKERFDQDLLNRVRSFSNTEVLEIFLQNHISILSYKGKHEKVRQLRALLISCYNARGLIQEALSEADRYVEDYPADAEILSLQQNLLAQAAGELRPDADATAQ